MSEPIEIILNTKKQSIRLGCGQCGDSKDIIIELDPDLNDGVVRVSILDVCQDIYNQEDEQPEWFQQPINIIV